MKLPNAVTVQHRHVDACGGRCCGSGRSQRPAEQDLIVMRIHVTGEREAEIRKSRLQGLHQALDRILSSHRVIRIDIDARVAEDSVDQQPALPGISLFQTAM